MESRGGKWKNFKENPRKTMKFLLEIGKTIKILKIPNSHVQIHSNQSGGDPPYPQHIIVIRENVTVGKY